MIGQSISHYKILEKLGEGGMGVVYKAEDTKLDRQVALKFLPKGLETHEQERSRFLQEAKAASALNHPNICNIHSLGEHEGQQFIDMEFVDGVTLREKIRSTQPSVNDVISYAIQIGEALHEAHSKGIVHRDVKPENIMVNTKNQIKVMDFGLAKLKGSLKLTKTSSTVGTLAYMAPEQIQGGEVDARSDIFSFGIVMYEMLSRGQRPFRGEHDAAIMYSIVNEEPEPIQKYREEISSECLHILNRALEKDPGERYQSINDMLIDLRRLMKQTGRVSPSSLSLPSSTTRTIPSVGIWGALKKTKILFFIGGSLVVVILILFLVYRDSILQPGSLETVKSVLKQVTFNGDVSLASISPDGKSTAYVRKVSRDERVVFVQDISGGQPIEIFKEKEMQSIHWSPDGSELLIPAGNGSTYGCYLVPRLGGVSHRLPYYQQVCWAIDGSKFAGILYPQKLIYMNDKSTGRITSRIPLTGVFTWLWDIDWSPTGTLFAFLTIGEKEKTIWTIKADGTQQSIVVQDSTRWINEPRWSSKGDAIYYISSDEYADKLMKVCINPSTGKADGAPIVVMSGIQGSEMTYSADNRRLLYNQSHSYSNLWTISDKNKNAVPKQLTTGTSSISWARLSPDRKRIVYSNFQNLFIQFIEGGRATQLTFLDSADIKYPVWSPDGKMIAFSGFQKSTRKIWIVNADGGFPTRFDNTENVNSYLEWAPGSQILYSSLDNRNLNLLDPKTGEIRPLLQNDSVGWLGSARYSPDGKQIAVLWHRLRQFGPPNGLWIISLSDSSQTLLHSGNVDPVAWSPDGKSIFCQQNDSPHIYILSLKGGALKKYFTFPTPNVGDICMDPAHKIIVYSVFTTISDAWLVENFDPEVE